MVMFMQRKFILSYIAIIFFVIFTIWSILFRVTISITLYSTTDYITPQNIRHDNYIYDNLDIYDYDNRDIRKLNNINNSNKFDKININSADVFVKQQDSDTCTLAAATMMLRRRAILDNRAWQNITEKSLRKSAWVDGAGLRWEFKYDGMSVKNAQFNKEDKQGQIKKLLKNHPEGIVVYYYDSVNQHAILLTDYTDGIFYCADPSNLTPNGRIEISTSQIVSVDNAIDYWYII